MPAGSHVLTTTVSASEFLQLVLKDIGNHQQDTYEDEFVLREPTNLGGERAAAGLSDRGWQVPAAGGA